MRPGDFSYTGRSKGRPRISLYELGPDAELSKVKDVFHQMNIDPLHEATNTVLVSRFVTRMGKIMTRAETSLTWKNQRRVGKAVRRARMMGVIPALSRRSLGAKD